MCKIIALMCTGWRAGALSCAAGTPPHLTCLPLIIWRFVFTLIFCHDEWNERTRIHVSSVESTPAYPSIVRVSTLCYRNSENGWYKMLPRGSRPISLLLLLLLPGCKYFNTRNMLMVVICQFLFFFVAFLVLSHPRSMWLNHRPRFFVSRFLSVQVLREYVIPWSLHCIEIDSCGLACCHLCPVF